MASAFLDYAHKVGFITARRTRYNVRGMAMVSAGGQYCYACE